MINTQPLPACLTKDMELKLQPLDVLEVWYDSNGFLKVLIQWKDLSSQENTWEKFQIIKEQLPSFHLEDKVTLIWEGIVRPSIMHVYKMKNKRIKYKKILGIVSEENTRQSGDNSKDNK